jgi:molybdate transport system ATP-binding protein
MGEPEMSQSSGVQAHFKLNLPDFTLDVDLDLPGRGVCAIFGRSGSGKTTLLRCIAGLEHPVDGMIEINGDIWQQGKHFVPTYQRPLGYVFQEPSLFPHLSVAGNLDYGMRRVPASQRKVAMEHAIDLLGIGQLLGRRPDNLSGGERQRVAIARALATSPRLLLLDEPLAALDDIRKREILPYLERLHADLDIPVLYVSHSAEEISRLADHLVVMSDGRCVAAGPLGETLSRIDLPIRLGDDVGVVLSGEIAEREAQWNLARVRCAGIDIWVRDGGQSLGCPVRVRVLARDISIAQDLPGPSSILNILPVTVTEIGDDDHPAQVLVKLKTTGTTALLARITRRSMHALNLVPGSTAYAQIKAVALIT